MKEHPQFLNLVWDMTKLAFLQILLSACFAGMVSASVSNGQDLLNQRITCTITDLKIKEALRVIERNSNARFMYSSKLIDANRRVFLSVTNASMSEVLEKLLRPLGLTYEVSGRQILLDQGSSRPAEPVPNAEIRPPQKLSGRVTDTKGEILPGVSVLIKGTQQGTVTNERGEFQLDLADKPQTLIFSSVGYISQEVNVASGQTMLEVSLKIDDKALEEVVVVGYGAQKKVNLTGAVGVIEAKQFESRPVSNVAQSLQGQVPGLLVNQTGGQPGKENFSIAIRGTSTFSTNPPLVIVDGIAMSLANLNPHDIESISVLKDAASTAIYGARASGGVILVTTKKGKDGKMRISYDGYVARETPTMLPKMVDAYHHVMLFREAEYNDNPKTTVFKYTEEEMEKYRTGQLPSEDRLAYLFRPATQTQHNLSLSGGAGRNTYFISMGYFKQGGMMVNTGSQRFNFRVNNTFKVNDRLDINLNAQFSPSVLNAPSEATYPSGPTRTVSDIIYDAYRRGSDDITFTSDGRWASVTGWANRFGLASRDGGFQERKFNRLTGALTINYKIANDITLTGIYGSKADLTRQVDFSKRMQFINPDDLKTVDFNYNTNSLLVYHGDGYQHNAQFLANYARVFAQKHDFKLLLGASQEWNRESDNMGWESQISYKSRIGGLSYRATFQISDARNKVRSMVASPQISGNKITQTGYKMDEWFGYKALGIFASQEEVDSYAKLNPKTGIGDLKIEDVNGDGKITADDRQRLGSSNARFPYGFQLELNYKNFDFSTFLQGVAYRKAYMSAVALPINGTLETAQEQHLDRWHYDGTSWIPGQFPKMRVASFNNQFSSFWLQNAAYLRMKHIQLGYSLPKALAERLRMERLRVYASGENLFTITKITGYDPEAPDGSGNFYPLARVVNLGINLTF